MGFTFAVTYMRINGFFSYEIFSLNSMWMFFMAFLYLFIIIFAFYGCLIAYIYFGFDKLSGISNAQKKNIKNSGTSCLYKNHIIILPKHIVDNTRFIRFCLYVYTLFLEIVFSYLAHESRDPLFCLIMKIYMGSTLLIMLLVLIVFLIDALKPQMIFLLGGFFLLLLYLYLVMYDRGEAITEMYKIFFKSRGLASDHAEIYLKSENKSVHGKLIFDDGKYAYVEFNRTDSNCGGIGVACEQTIRKKVPSEDVSILVSSKQ